MTVELKNKTYKNTKYKRQKYKNIKIIMYYNKGIT